MFLGGIDLDDMEMSVELGKAEHAARVERIRNVLDNRGVDYEPALVEELAGLSEESLREYLLSVGIEPRNP